MSAGQFLVPCQLPDPPAWLAGRDAEINALDQMLAAPEGWPLTVVVSGVPGVGKTALASWWLHEHRRQFSEGQFYARLAGPLGMGETPWEVLGRWLRAFGVPTVSIPASRAGRERLWKAMTAGRRLAIMIDDAPSASAVEALVPGQGPAPLVVTSRRMLGAGSPTGFRQLRLRPLKRPAAIGLLVRQLGPTETTRDTASPGDLARACSGLPLALRCAAWMITCPNNTDPGLTVQLAAEETRLAARGVPRSEARARALIEVTSQLLEPDVARAFRLLAFCPGPELSSELAVAMLDTSPAQTCALLGDLARAGLIERAGYGWWKFHDLAQLHAREQAGRIGTGLERQAATSRMLTWYVCAAISAHAALVGSVGAEVGNRTWHQHGSPIFSPASAADWVDRHQPAMMAAVRAAAACGDHATAVCLAGVLWPLLGWHGCYGEQLATVQLGVRAARACGDAPAEAQMLNGMGHALRQLGRPSEAARPFRGAARIWLELGRDGQLAVTLRELGRIAAAQGLQAEASRYFTQAARLCQHGGNRRHRQGGHERALWDSHARSAGQAANRQGPAGIVTDLYGTAAGIAILCAVHAAVRLWRDRSLTQAMPVLCMLAAGAALALTAANPVSLQVPPTAPSIAWASSTLGLLATWMFLGVMDAVTSDTGTHPGILAIPVLGAASAGLLQMALRAVPGAGTRPDLSFLVGQLVLLTYYCPGLWRIATLAWQCSRRIKTGHLHVGMRAVSYAAAAELVLILLRSATIIERSSGVPVARPELAAIGAAEAVAVIQIIGGATISAWFPGLAKLTQQGLLWYAYWRLHLLWATLRRAVPQVELPRQSGTRFNVRYRLHRRVIEIRDAQLLLRPYWRSDIAGQAAAAARSAGLTEPKHSAVVEAAVIVTAVNARQQGSPPRHDDIPAEHPSALSNGLRAEAAHLILVSRAMRHSRIVSNLARPNGE